MTVQDEHAPPTGADALQVDQKPTVRYDVGMLQRYRILTLLCACRYRRDSAACKAKAAVLAAKVAP